MVRRGRNPRRQLATVHRVNRAHEDLNGAPMTEDKVQMRILALTVCDTHRRAFEALDGWSDQGELIEDAVTLFDKLGITDDDDVSRKTETFLCITYSGLLPLCVDVALKALEAGERLPVGAHHVLTSECLAGAKGVSYQNWMRCSDFVDAHLVHDSLPQDMPEDLEPIFQRWAWYLECGRDNHSYYERYHLEECLAFLDKIADADVFRGIRVRGEFIAALESHVFEEEAELAEIESIPEDDLPVDSDAGDSN